MHIVPVGPVSSMSMSKELGTKLFEYSFAMHVIPLHLHTYTLMYNDCRYVNGVKPGQYGVPKPFYFPFLPSYWLGRPMTSNQGLTNVVSFNKAFIFFAAAT